MSKKTAVTPLAVALGTFVTISLAQAADVHAAGNPFAMEPISSAPLSLAAGKCGEGKCGAGMMGKGKGKGREGKCGMARMDSNGDGKVTKEEFMQGHEAMFHRIDANGDGVIDQSERAAHMSRMKGFMKGGKCGG